MKNFKTLVIVNSKGYLVTTSLTISRELNRRHHDVLRLIDYLARCNTGELQCFFKTSYKNSQGKTYRMYEVTRSGVGFIQSELHNQGKLAIDKFYDAFEYSTKHCNNSICVSRDFGPLKPGCEMVKEYSGNTTSRFNVLHFVARLFRRMIQPTT